MPRTFLAQCIAGLQDVVADELVRDVNADIQHIEEGQVVFSGGKVDEPAYINNLFLVLHSLKGRDMAFLLAACAHETKWHVTARQNMNKGEETFRLFLSDENQLVSADKAPLGKLIAQIEKTCRVVHSSHRPDTEFWLFRRRGGAAYLCKRITKNRQTEKDLKPGELRPELAQLLCRLSEPAATDVFLDPFAGSGNIPAARSEWPYKKIYASDIAPKKSKIETADALNLNKIADASIDKVVTDPPWGFFDNNIKDIPAFYKKTLQELCRVLKPNGIIVMLTGQRELAGELSRQFTDQLTLEHRYDILVSGKKASVMKWRRKNVE